MSRAIASKVHAPRRLAASVLPVALALTLAAGGCGGKTPALTPVPDCDGIHLLVMTSGRNALAGQHNIFLYDLDAGGFRALLNFGGTGQDQHPAITSDGKVIAVERTGAGTGQDVLIYDRCAGGFLIRPELITAADETEPTFSTDGNELAFVRDTAGTRRVRMYDGFSRRFVPLHLLDSLAATGFDSQSPSLDRTGAVIAFTTGSAPTRKIWLYSRNGDSLFTSLSNAIDTPNDERDPWLTPDAHYLAFASDRPGGKGLYDIYLYDLQARAYVATDSLNSSGNDVHPSMSSDGVYIFFQSDRTGALAKGKWDIYNYNRTLNAINQGFQESSTEDDVDPYVAWP